MTLWNIIVCQTGVSEGHTNSRNMPVGSGEVNALPRQSFREGVRVEWTLQLFVDPHLGPSSSEYLILNRLHLSFSYIRKSYFLGI